MKRLSENLEALSERAARAVQAVAAAREEARDQLEERREQLRADAERAIDKVEEAMQKVPDQAASELAALKAKIGVDRARMKARLDEIPREIKAQDAEGRAEDLVLAAALSVDYASAAVAQAALAALDAICARRDADEAKLEPHPMAAQ